MKKKFNWIMVLIVIGFSSFFIMNIYALNEEEEKMVQGTQTLCMDIVKKIILNLAMEKYSDAETLSRSMIQEDSGCKIKGLSLLSEIYFLQGKMEQYQITLQKLYQLTPRKAENLSKFLNETPKDKILAAIAIFEGDLFSGNDLIIENIKEANILLLPRKVSQDRLRRVKKLIKEVLKIEPDNLEARYLLGDCYMEEAEELDYKDQPKEKLRLLDLAKVCQKKAAKSSNQITKVKALQSLNVLGSIYQVMDEDKRLVEVGKIILKYKPKDTTAQRWSEIKVKDNIGEIKPSPTVDIPEELRSMSPDEIREYFKKKSERRKNLPKREQWEETWKEFPDNPNFAFMLALEYLSMPGDLESHEKAKSLLQKAIKLKPDFSVAIYELGKYYYNNNQKSKAIEEFKKVENLAPGFIADEYKELLDETP